MSIGGQAAPQSQSFFPGVGRRFCSEGLLLGPKMVLSEMIPVKTSKAWWGKTRGGGAREKELKRKRNKRKTLRKKFLGAIWGMMGTISILSLP